MSVLRLRYTLFICLIMVVQYAGAASDSASIRLEVKHTSSLELSGASITALPKIALQAIKARRKVFLGAINVAGDFSGCNIKIQSASQYSLNSGNRKVAGYTLHASQQIGWGNKAIEANCKEISQLFFTGADGSESILLSADHDLTDIVNITVTNQ